MGIYTDANGKQWEFSVNYGLILFLKSSLNIDLLEPYTNGNTTLQDVLTNRYKMLELLFQTVKYSNKAAKDDDIWNSFSGDCVVKAQEALFNDWADFSQASGRPDTAAAIRKAQELLQAGIRAAELEIEAIDSTEAIKRISQDAKKELQTLMNSSGNLPAE
jgi:hypothetical protein